ncbi:MAG: GDSL-type esterase/lipase family protein [Povalibacter sp.]
MAILIAMLIALSDGAHASSLEDNPAIVPTDRLAESWWAARHEAVLQQLRDKPDTQLLLIGDSITNNYDKADLPDENFRPTWDQFYGSRGAVNLGFSGDTTAHVLWRLQHGEIDGIAPKVAIVLIGTNNTGWANHTAEQTKSGIDAVIAELEQRLPRTRILLLGILPTEISSEKTERDREVNMALAASYALNPRVTYLDISSIFYKNGSVNPQIFYDPRLQKPGKPLHPDTVGQRMMAEAIEPTLSQLMDEGPRIPLQAMTAFNTALIPVPQLEQDSYDWYARHFTVLATQKQMQPRVVLIGDSITHFWGGTPLSNHLNGPLAWKHAFADTAVLNMGFGWDRTQNVLWRLRQGEFEDLHPKWIVLNIGTNNFVNTAHARANTPEETTQGIEAICNELRQRSPNSRILLMAIFPRGASPADPIRTPIEATNRLLKQRYESDPVVKVLDVNKQFLAEDKSIPAALMPDQVHPSEAGYKIWADALIEAGVEH